MLTPQMIPSKARLSDTERALLDVVRRLPEAQRQTLQDYAEFLLARHGEEAQPPVPRHPERPEVRPRPEKESVVGAIKRLSASYPMLDKTRMLNDTSALMTAHLIQGRAAPAVIDELEQLFLREYQHYLDSFDEPSA